MHPDAHQAKCGNTVYQISILELNLSLNVTLRWIFYAVSGREEIRGLWAGEGDGWRWRKSWGRGVGGLAGCCHPAVFRMKAHSGVNLLEELESSAGCHLFSTLSTPPPFSFSPVNRVISTALVSASHFSLSLSVKMALLSIALTSDVLMNQTHQAVF